MESLKVAWLIPCRNESHTIGKVIADIKEHCPQANVYVFDNNSTDDTGRVAEGCGAVVIREPRRGKGHVVRSMFEAIDADLYILIDGDDTYRVSMWKELLKPVIAGEADMVVATRLTDHTGDSFRSMHLLGNRIITMLINIFFSANLSDILSGYRAFNRDFVKGIALNAKEFEIEAELTIQALENRFLIKEVPSSYKGRSPGSFSKLNTFRDGFLILYTIIRLVKDYKPLTFFGGVAIVFGLAAVFLALFRSDKVYIVSTLISAIITLSSGVILNAISQRAKELGQILRKQGPHSYSKRLK